LLKFPLHLLPALPLQQKTDKEEDSPRVVIRKVEKDLKERKKRLSGNPSLNLEDWLKLNLLKALLIFSDSLSPSRSKRLSMLSWEAISKKKSCKSNLFRNKLKLVKEPDSKLSLLLVMRRITLDWDGNVTRKFKEPSREPSLWLNLTSFLSERDIGVTRSVVPTPSLEKLLERVDQSK
jgi:hypothetical protein